MIAPLYDLIYVFPLSQILILVAGPYVGIPEKSILGCVCSILVLAFIQLIRYLNIKGKFISLGIACATFLGVYFALGKERFSTCIDKYSWLGVCVVLAILAYVIGILAINKQMVRRLGGLSSFGIAIYLMIVEEPVTKYASVMFFLIILLCLAEEVQRKWVKSGYTKIKDHMVMIFPILFIMCLAVVFMKTPDKPYDWKFAKDAWDKITVSFGRMSEWFKKPEESYGDIGFSGDSSFVSKLDATDKDAMRIKVYRDNPSSIYLAGKYFDTFDENGWGITAKDGVNSRMMDTIETRCAVSKYDFENEDDYIVKTKNDIESHMNNTKYIFTPQKAVINNKMFTDVAYSESAGVVNSKEKIREGDSYRVLYYKLNMTHPNMIDLINNADEITKKEWESGVRKELYKENPEFSYDKYIEYSQWVYDNYSSGGAASDRVKELLENIISSEQGDYENMKALEEYLKGFSYSSAPGALPDSVSDSKSYLDYFMFESKKGYCVHFATAFVLLARECGMPARYVQGYRFDKGNGEVVDVKESFSHAWAEVYFDNVGWIAFEPTPGYSNDCGWKVVRDNDKKEAASDKGSEYTDKRPETTTEFEDITTEEVDSYEESIEDKLTKVYINLKVVVIPICAVFVFLCIYIFMSRVLWKRKYMRFSKEDKIKNLTNRNFRILKLLGYGLSQYETLSEYKNRIKDEISDELFEKLIFIDLYEDIIYADRQIDLDMIKQFEDSHIALKNELCDTKHIYRIFNL